MENVHALFFGMFVIAAMQLGQFWFAVSKHKRAEASVQKEELDKVESRLDDRIKKMERKLDQAKDSTEHTLAQIFDKLNSTSEKLAKVESTMEHLDQRSIRLESKVDALK